MISLITQGADSATSVKKWGVGSTAIPMEALILDLTP